MKSRDFLVGAAVVATLVVAAVAVLLLHGSGRSSRPSVQAPARRPTAISCPTPLPTPAATRTLHDAINLVEQYVEASNPSASVYLSYVDTTFGGAATLLDPQRLTNYYWPDDAAAWFFVAAVPKGGYPPGTTPTHGTAYAIVPKTCGSGSFEGLSNQEIDLRALGRVVQVPGPLPTFSLTPRPSPTTRPTRTPPSLFVNTLDDAIRLTAGFYTGHGGNLLVANPRSVSYVATTVGQAKAMFDPNRPGDWGMPADTPVWVFVPYGTFSSSGFCMGCAHPLTPVPVTAIPATTAWVVVVQGASLSFKDGYSYQQYDLSHLGTPVQLDPSQWNKY